MDLRVCLREVCVSFQIMLDALACLSRYSLNSARRPPVEAPTTSYDYGFGYKVHNDAFFSKAMYSILGDNISKYSLIIRLIL